MSTLKEPNIQFNLFASRTEEKLLPIDDHFAVDFVDTLAERESYNKHLFRPNTYLHKWWARRCGTTFRAILKHLVTDELLQGYYTAGGLENMVILDPMMGGGTTLHEAIRLNANVIGADIDPIPILQARATLSEISITDLKRAFAQLMSHLENKLVGLYDTFCPDCAENHPLQFLLYGLKVNCGCKQAILVDSFLLRHNSDNSKIQIDPNTHAIFVDAVCVAESDQSDLVALVEKANKICSDCQQKYIEDTSIPYYQRYEPLVIVTKCPKKGLRMLPVRKSDLLHIERADSLRPTAGFSEIDFVINNGPKSKSLLGRKINHYLDLFSSRQLIFIHHATEALDNFNPTVKLNLALLLSTSLEFNSMLCGYKGSSKSRPGAIRHTFAHHAYSFPYTALENNPIYAERTSGTLRNLFSSRILRGKKWSQNPEERLISNGKVSKKIISGETDLGTEVANFEELVANTKQFMLLQGSSVKLALENDSVDFIVTDPPYFDSVQYGDLAAYFRVWLRQLLPADVDWNYELANAAVDQHRNGNGQYASVLGEIFKECNRVLKKDGRMIFTFHHWNPKGWTALTLALKYAQFELVNRYVVHAENPTSVHIANQKSLLHDVVLVLRPKTEQNNTRWLLPERCSTEDSRTFIEECGTVLGALLGTGMSDKQIREAWNELIQ